MKNLTAPTSSSKATHIVMEREWNERISETKNQKAQVKVGVDFGVGNHDA
jgi:hypothetical protein